tara:strand:- start:662 stop:961 length:300 start_codon:yes stop_codon:yes gene_type:complete
MSGPYIFSATSSKYNQFEALGHPGRYTNAYTYTGGQVDFTGSNFGYGAVLVKTHGSADIKLSGGGTISASNLPNDVIELSVSKIDGGSNAVIYVLKRQQ